jgi:hypothetical protein
MKSWGGICSAGSARKGAILNHWTSNHSSCLKQRYINWSILNIQVNSKYFWQWYIIFKITRFLAFVRCFIFKIQHILNLGMTERANVSHCNQYFSCFNHSSIIIDCWRKPWNMLCAESLCKFPFLSETLCWLIYFSWAPTISCLQIYIKKAEHSSSRWTLNHHLEYLIMRWFDDACDSTVK